MLLCRHNETCYVPINKPVTAA